MTPRSSRGLSDEAKLLRQQRDDAFHEAVNRRGLVWAVKQFDGTFVRWAAKDYMPKSQSYGQLHIIDIRLSLTVHIYAHGSFVEVELQLPATLASHYGTGWAAWTPSDDINDPKYLQPTPQEPDVAKADPEKEPPAPKGEDGREWHYCESMTTRKICEDRSHVEHKQRKYQGRGWWDYTLEAAPKAERRTTPGYDGPEGTEWPGGFNAGMIMVDTGRQAVEQAMLDEQRALIQRRDRERF